MAKHIGCGTTLVSQGFAVDVVGEMGRRLCGAKGGEIVLDLASVDCEACMVHAGAASHAIELLMLAGRTPARCRWCNGKGCCCPVCGGGHGLPFYGVAGDGRPCPGCGDSRYLRDCPCIGEERFHDTMKRLSELPFVVEEYDADRLFGAEVERTVASQFLYMCAEKWTLMTMSAELVEVLRDLLTALAKEIGPADDSMGLMAALAYASAKDDGDENRRKALLRGQMEERAKILRVVRGRLPTGAAIGAQTEILERCSAFYPVHHRLALGAHWVWVRLMEGAIDVWARKNLA